MTYYQAKRDLDESQYPFKGADPIMVEPNRASVNQILNKMTDHNEAITWRQAHEICYFIAYQTRQFLQRELLSESESFIPFRFPEEKNITKNLLTIACLHASSYAYFLTEKMGLKNTTMHNSNNLLKNILPHKYHAFLTIELPIKTKKRVKRERFIIDSTYRQFFAEYRFKTIKPDLIVEPNQYNLENIGIKYSKKFSTKVMADHLLKFGFIHASKKITEFYIKGFSNEGDSIALSYTDKQVLEMISEPSTPQTSGSPKISNFFKSEMVSMDIDAICDETINKRLHQVKNNFKLF